MFQSLRTKFVLNKFTDELNYAYKQATGMTKISRGGYFRPGGGYFGFSAQGGVYTPLWKNRKFGF